MKRQRKIRLIKRKKKDPILPRNGEKKVVRTRNQIKKVIKLNN